MSYSILLYHPDVKALIKSGKDFEEIDTPVIPEPSRQKFAERLVRYDYRLDPDEPGDASYIHKNEKWGIQVTIFDSEIAFSVPYWNDAENAIFEEIPIAHELIDGGDVVVFDPQTGAWGMCEAPAVKLWICSNVRESGLRGRRSCRTHPGIAYRLIETA